MNHVSSFAGLPTEIAFNICTFLQQQDVSRLSATSKDTYPLFRPILYRHPNISSFTSLTLFSRTFTRATYMGKADHKWSTQDCLDQTKTMDLTIDQAKDSARNNGQPPAAVLVSRFIQAIVRRCPNLDITLRFAHCQCAFAPVSALCSETFPRVTKLILYVGRHDPEGTHGRARTSCAPNAKFWRPLVNGMSFPDCLNLEIRHYWASSPPAHASLDLRKRYSNVSINYGNSRIPQQRGFFGGRRDFMDVPLRADQIVGPTRGLKQFQSVILECPPELDSPLLMQLLGNPDSVAVNLAKLELRFCNLDYETISMLLYHAPPNLKHLVLLCWDNRDLHGHGATECPHLCPLIRDFSKKLDHLEFAASTVCRELFFDDREIQSLNKNGITTGLGSGGGAIEGHDKLDVHAIRETVEDCRRQKRLKYRTSRIEEAVTAAKARIGAATATSSLFGGGAGANLSAARAQREAEVLLDEEEEQRSRSIERSKRPWFRRIITWHGLCHPNDTWEEVQLAAGMEETGVEWVVVNKDLGVASQHSGGKLPIDLELGRAFEEKFHIETGQLSAAEDLCHESDPEADPLDDL